MAENTKTRGQIIKQTILAKCSEREIQGYQNLTDSDVTEILETLSSYGIELTRKEMIALGFEEDTDEGSSEDDLNTLIDSL